MKIKDLRGLSSEELVQKERIFKKELFDLNYQRKLSTVEKPASFRKLKRNIAKIFTILRERELENERNRKEAK